MGRRFIEVVVGKGPKVVDFEGDLEAMQDFVGGYVSAVPLQYENVYMDLVINDEGKLINLPKNMLLNFVNIDYVESVVGNALVVGLDRSEGEWVSLTDEQIRVFFNHLGYTYVNDDELKVLDVVG